MILSRFLRHIADGHLHAAGANLGNELPRNRFDLLRTARAELAKLLGYYQEQRKQDNDYLKGYLEAMTDILAAYENAVENKQ
jgi:hypothetical protein